MLTDGKFFIEIDCCQHTAAHELASGNVYFQKRYDDHIVAVLCDGGSSGVVANILASTVGSIAVNAGHASLPEIARTALEFLHKSRTRGAGFAIVRIRYDLQTEVVEYGMPPIFCFHKGKRVELPFNDTPVRIGSEDVPVRSARFKAYEGLMAFVLTRGVLDSGKGTFRMPDGWSSKEIVAFIEKNAKENISARRFAGTVIDQALANDLFVPKNDLSCGVLYVRQPRKILVCTGPPYEKDGDAKLAKIVGEYPGDIILSGGTTAQIIARELKREIRVLLDRRHSDIPPRSEMEGISMVTEGVLTLNKVKETLNAMKGSRIRGKGTDALIIRKLLEHDIIEFVVGTRINALHQNPNIPVELALRRNVVKDIAHILQEKFMKEVVIQYI